MRVLVIGSGGREHALCARLAADPGVGAVLVAPGNPGTARRWPAHPVETADLAGLARLARQERVDLTVVGPEAPLAAGIAGHFAREGLLLLGPTAAAARLETSKAFAKDFMARHGVPTAGYRTCRTPAEAMAAIEAFGLPVVLKADGLAAGKGVVVAEDRAAAAAAVHAALVEGCFGEAGRVLVVEEFLRGDEASFFCLCDGVRALPIGTAQDHKRAFDDDRGPNTGGMGAFAPSPLVTPAVHERVMAGIVQPVLDGMRAEGQPYRGFLYVGLMLTADGPFVIEFNVRFGDPEAQVVLPLVDEPLAPLLAAAAAGRLGARTCRMSADHAVGVVLASGGYPGTFEKGKAIEGIPDAESLPGVTVLHAGTAERGGVLLTNGGRVLTIVGRAAGPAEAMARAYAGADLVRFEGKQMRRDIGKKAVSLQPSAFG
jgi:phosphoribosylamine--glycine ligase